MRESQKNPARMKNLRAKNLENRNPKARANPENAVPKEENKNRRTKTIRDPVIQLLTAVKKTPVLRVKRATAVENPKMRDPGMETREEGGDCTSSAPSTTLGTAIGNYARLGVELSRQTMANC